MTAAAIAEVRQFGAKLRRLGIDAEDLVTCQAAALDLVMYFAAVDPHELRPDLPVELHASLSGDFEDATWEGAPTYEAPLNRIALGQGVEVASQIKDALVAIAMLAAADGPMGMVERSHLARLRSQGESTAGGNILFVHGIGQAKEAPDELFERWRTALRRSLEEVGIQLELSDRTRLAYYADLEADFRGAGPTAAELFAWVVGNLSGHGSISVPDLAPGMTVEGVKDRLLFDGGAWLVRQFQRSRNEMVSARTDLEARPLVAVDSMGEPDDRTSRFPSRARIGRMLSRLSPSARDTVVASLREVHLYLTEPDFRARVQERIAEAVGTEPPAVVVGHSLGSVVAMDYVLSERRRVPCLVTLGSPLWMASVMATLFRWHDRDRPVEIGEWLNVFDGRDVVGGGLPMRRTWGDGPTDVKVDQGAGPTYHGIDGYLSKPEVALVLERVADRLGGV